MNAPTKLAPILWFQGPPLSGKTTLALALQSRLEQEHVACQVLDEAELNLGLNADKPGQVERIRRIAEMAKLLASKGWVTMVAADCASEAEQAQIQHILGDAQLKTILMECPTEVRAARAEEQGRTLPTDEAPITRLKSDLVLKSHVHPPDACLERVLTLVDSLLQRDDVTGEETVATIEGEAQPSGRALPRKGFTPNWDELRSLSQIRAKNERPEDHVKRKRPPTEQEMMLGMSGATILNISLLVAGALGLGFLISQVRDNYERAKKENGTEEQNLRVQRTLETGPASETSRGADQKPPVSPPVAPKKED